MELSEKCVKEVAAVIEGEVKRGVAKAKQRQESAEKETKKLREVNVSLKAEVEKGTKAQRIAEARITELDKKLREADVTEKALKSALAEKAEEVEA